MRVVVVPSTAGLSHPFFSGCPTKNGAPAISRPTTEPRFHSSTAPSARLYQSTALGASGTASMTEISIEASWSPERGAVHPARTICWKPSEPTLAISSTLPRWCHVKLFAFRLPGEQPHKSAIGTQDDVELGAPKEAAEPRK